MTPYKTSVFKRVKARANRLKRQGINRKLVTVSKKLDERLDRYLKVKEVK